MEDPVILDDVHNGIFDKSVLSYETWRFQAVNEMNDVIYVGLTKSCLADAFVDWNINSGRALPVVASLSSLTLHNDIPAKAKFSF